MKAPRFSLMSSISLSALVCLLCISVSFNAQAEGAFFDVDEITEETGFYQPNFLLELAYGPDMSHIEFGMDFQKEKNMGFAGLYFSLTDYEMKGSDTATMSAVGIRGLKYSSTADDSIGADLHLGINQTKAGDYERTGVEFALSFYESLNEDTSLILGFSFRPEFLAFDWNEGVITESGFEFGVNHRITPKMNLFAKYYYENLWQDNISSERIDDGVLAGFNYSF